MYHSPIFYMNDLVSIASQNAVNPEHSVATGVGLMALAM